MTHPPFRPPHSHPADTTASHPAKADTGPCCGREDCCGKARHDANTSKSSNTPGINSVTNSPQSGKKSARNSSAA